MKTASRRTVDNDNDSETSDGRGSNNNNNNNNNKTAYYTQAATFVANGIEHSVIQQSTAKRWVLRAILNENFDSEFLMSYGSLFQKTGPADEKDF